MLGEQQEQNNRGPSLLAASFMANNAARVYVGGLRDTTTERELEDEVRAFEAQEGTRICLLVCLLVSLSVCLSLCFPLSVSLFPFVCLLVNLSCPALLLLMLTPPVPALWPDTVNLGGQEASRVCLCGV